MKWALIAWVILSTMHNIVSKDSLSEKIERWLYLLVIIALNILIELR